MTCYLARRSLCEIINSTLGMLIHRWIGDTLFRTCIKLKSKQRERQWCISVSALFANAFKNEAMSVPSKINEMVCPYSNFESRLLCFLPICEKLSELTAGRIFLLLSKALLGSLLWFYCILIFWAICYKTAFEQPNLKSLIVFFILRDLNISVKKLFYKENTFQINYNIDPLWDYVCHTH